MEKIKVVFIDYKLVCGGAEQALFDLINLMDKEKFDVTVFAQCPGGAWDRKFMDAGIRVIYDYSCRKPTFNPITKAGNVVKKLKTAQAYKNDGEGLLDVILEEGADIVVSYSAWGYDQIAFARNAKTVKYIHGDPGTDPVYRDEAIRKKEHLSRFDRIVCVSTSARDAFREMSGLSDSVRLHYNPINSENVRRLAETEVEFPTDVPVICAVGRLSVDKTFERLIIMHKNLLNEGIRHKVLIVGDGEDREYLERLIRATDTENTVILAGYQSNPYPYIKRSKFLVNCSYAEGMPVTAMEALTLGIPIVAPIPSIGELFGDQVCGIITENDNASLQSAIRKMLTDDAFYALAKAGAENRREFFDGKRMVKELEDMFLDLVKQ